MSTIVLGFVKLAICITSTLFSILAMALPYWIVETDGTQISYYGLWKKCAINGKCDYGVDKKARPIEDLERAMVTISVFLLITALICAAIQLKQGLERDGSASISYVAAGLSASAGVCLLVAFSAVADDVNSRTSSVDTLVESAKKQIEGMISSNLSLKSNIDITSFGSSFGLAIVGWLLSWLQSGLFIGIQHRVAQQTDSSTP